jgi:hypothetical protein
MKSQNYDLAMVAMAVKQHEKELQLLHEKRKREFQEKYAVRLKTNKSYTALEQP